LKDTRVLNTGGSDNRGDQGRTDSEFREEHIFGEDGGSTEFRWRRGSEREEWNWNKGFTKRENKKIGMVQGKSEVLEKGQRGRLEWVSPSDSMCMAIQWLYYGEHRVQVCLILKYKLIHGIIVEFTSTQQDCAVSSVLCCAAPPCTSSFLLSPFSCSACIWYISSSHDVHTTAVYLMSSPRSTIQILFFSHLFYW